MEKYKEIYGNLITLTKTGEFDIITHGVNCFNTQKAGIALVMAENFSSNKFKLESPKYYADYNKLGQIDYENVDCSTGQILNAFNYIGRELPDNVIVVNSYTQFNMGRNLNYTALQMCLNKINNEFSGQHIGLPLIGCGIAGGDWEVVKKLIQTELKDMKVTVVKFKK